METEAPLIQKMNFPSKEEQPSLEDDLFEWLHETNEGNNPDTADAILVEALESKNMSNSQQSIPQWHCSTLSIEPVQLILVSPRNTIDQADVHARLAPYFSQENKCHHDASEFLLKIPVLSVGEEVYDQATQDNYILQEEFEWIYIYNQDARSDLLKLLDDFALLYDEEEDTEVETINVIYDTSPSQSESPKVNVEDDWVEEILNPFFQNGENLVFSGDYSHNSAKSLYRILKRVFGINKIDFDVKSTKNVFTISVLVNFLYIYTKLHVSHQDCLYILNKLLDHGWITSPYASPASTSESIDDNTVYYYLAGYEPLDTSIILNREFILEDSSLYDSPTRNSGLPITSFDMILRLQLLAINIFTEFVDYSENIINFHGIRKSEYWIALRTEVSYLRRINVDEIHREHLVPFWINIHNVFHIHSVINSLDRKRQAMISGYSSPLDSKDMLYVVGKLRVSQKEVANILRNLLRGNDQRERSTPDPRLHFCLTDSAKLSPMPRVYTIRYWDMEMNEATSRYIFHHSYIDKTRRCFYLPVIVSENRQDFGETKENAVQFAFEHMQRLKQIEFSNMKAYGSVEIHWSLDAKTIEDARWDTLPTLNYVISNKSHREIFKFFCLKEYSSENVLFWEDVQSYKSLATAHVNAQQQLPIILMDSAQNLYRKYIKRGAAKELNISQSQVDAISQIVLKPSKWKETTINLFDEIERSIANVMNDAFMRFKFTKEFDAIVQEHEKEERNNKQH